MSSLTQTFVIENEGSFLMVRRSLDEEHYPGFWAFPGGRVEPGEIPLESMVREIREETGLEILDQYSMLDSYGFANRSAYAFLVRAISREVTLSDESLDFEWISSLEDMQKRQCIEGIYYHFQQAQKTMALHKSLGDFSLLSLNVPQAIQEVSDKQKQILEHAVFRSIQEDTLSVDKYPNKN